MICVGMRLACMCRQFSLEKKTNFCACYKCAYMYTVIILHIYTHQIVSELNRKLPIKLSNLEILVNTDIFYHSYNQSDSIATHPVILKFIKTIFWLHPAHMYVIINKYIEGVSIQHICMLPQTNTLRNFMVEVKLFYISSMTLADIQCNKFYMIGKF